MSPLMVLAYVAIIVIICIVVINTNSSSKALAYLMLIISVPIVGVILYFTVGVNYRKRKLYKKKLKINDIDFPEFENRMSFYSDRMLEKNKEALQYFYKLALYNYENHIIKPCERVEVLINGEQKFPRLIEDLRNAKESIHLEYYIYVFDDIGKEIGDILIEKAKEGVEVRFMYDDFGSKGLNKSYINELKKAGVEMVPFYKIRWYLFANGINYRNHRKIAIIDGKIGFTGGINVSDQYINNGRNKLYWRDSSIRIEGLPVWNMQQIFLVDWNFCANQNIEFENKYFPMPEVESHINKPLVQIVSSGPDSDHTNILYAMVQAILLAKKEVLITTPYFVPDASFIDALKIASLSGVKVQLLVPAVGDSKVVNAVSSSYYLELLEVGVEIFKYEKGFVHAKTMVCDELVSFVGTANLDQRSFDLNFELLSITYDSKFAKQLKSVFNDDLKNAVKIDLIQWENRSIITVFLERAARLVSPLM